MSKHNSDPKTFREAQKVVGYHCKELEEMAVDVGRKMMADQAEWLDAQMKDILTPELYEAGKVGAKEAEIGEYMRKHDIRIIFIPDRQALRIMIGQRVHSQFLTRFTVDGEPVKVESTGFTPDPSQN